MPIGCAAQKNTGTNVNSYKTIYAKAVEYGDLNTAINAAHNILANSPSDYYYMDSLATLYYAVGNYTAAINVGNDILAAAPQNTAVQEIVANSYLASGEAGYALLSFQDLYTRTGYLSYLYKMATIQFGMQNYTEAGATLDKVISSEKSMTQIPLTGEDGETQSIPLKAAALNMKGAIAVQVNNTTIAKQNFEEALKIAPDFALAKKNLAELAKK